MKIKKVLIAVISVCAITSALSFHTFADWQTDGDSKSYILTNGKKATGLALVDDIRYKFDGDGTFVGLYSGWSQSRSTGDYYYYIDGIRQTNYWYNRNGVRSYFDENGKMVTSAKNIGGYDYNFRANGLWDCVLPENIKQNDIHAKLLSAASDYYGGLYLNSYTGDFIIYSTDLEKMKNIVEEMYPDFHFFSYESCEYSFKTLKSVHDELNGKKINKAEIKMNDYSEQQETYFSSYGFYYNIVISDKTRGFDYYDSLYRAHNYAESVYAKYNVILTEETAFESDDFFEDEEDYEDDIYSENGIDYKNFNFFFSKYTHVSSIKIDVETGDEYVDWEVTPVPYNYTVIENDFYYKSDICTRVFATEDGSYNIYVKEIDGYINEVADYYKKNGYTVTKKGDTLLLNKNNDKYFETSLNFIKCKYSINELISPYINLNNNLSGWRVYIDNSFLSHYEDVYKTAENGIKVYCYQDYDKVKKIINKYDSGCFELIKKY